MTKEYLLGQIQATDAALVLLDIGLVMASTPAPEWIKALRQDLDNSLVHYRRLLEETQPVTLTCIGKDYLQGYLEGKAEVPTSQANMFDLLLADEVRKAYDQGDSQGYSKGYNTGYDWGKKDGKVLGYAEGYDEGRSEAQSYSQYIQANAHRMREGWQPVCFDEFMESEFLVENEP